MQISFHPFGLLCPTPVPAPRCQSLRLPGMHHLATSCCSWAAAGESQLAGVVSGCVLCSVMGLGNTMSASGTWTSSEELLWRRAAQVIRSMFIDFRKEQRFCFCFPTAQSLQELQVPPALLCAGHCCSHCDTGDIQLWTCACPYLVFTLRLAAPCV